MAEPFRVALSGDFRKEDGSPTYPDFDLAPLKNAPGVEMAFLEPENPLSAEQLEEFDALILLAHRFARESVPKSGRLAVVARFGVGYDTVDVPACTDAGIRSEERRVGKESRTRGAGGSARTRDQTGRQDKVA